MWISAGRPTDRLIDRYIHLSTDSARVPQSQKLKFDSSCSWLTWLLAFFLKLILYFQEELFPSLVSICFKPFSFPFLEARVTKNIGTICHLFHPLWIKINNSAVNWCNKKNHCFALKYCSPFHTQTQSDLLFNFNDTYSVFIFPEFSNRLRKSLGNFPTCTGYCLKTITSTQPVNPPSPNKEASGNGNACVWLWNPSFTSHRARRVELAWSRSINDEGAWYKKKNTESRKNISGVETANSQKGKNRFLLISVR